MVIDDEELVLKAMARLLDRLGYEVVGYHCPEQAPEAYDAVISDFRMPNMNGLQVAEQFLSLKPKLPILLVSGYTGDIDSERARRIGVESLRSKPLSAQELTDWLTSAICAGSAAEGGSAG
jgi:two-component system cell cycle sensor histidine kinase/response regulator CckA